MLFGFFLLHSVTKPQALTMKHKFYLLLLMLPLLISFNLSNQSVLKQDLAPLSNLEASPFSLVNTWQVNDPAFFDTNVENYTLSLEIHRFGDFIEFKKDKTFEAYNKAPCRRACFTKTTGTYTIKDDVIEVFVVSAQQTGLCPNLTRFSNKKIGTFKITEKTKDTLLLKQI